MTSGEAFLTKYSVLRALSKIRRFKLRPHRQKDVILLHYHWYPLRNLAINFEREYEDPRV